MGFELIKAETWRFGSAQRTGCQLLPINHDRKSRRWLSVVEANIEERPDLQWEHGL
jgi:hypothetical protein